MKKWFKFFGLSFFEHKSAKEGARRGYTNVFLGFILALVFLWSGFVGGDMLPFGTHYNNSPDFMATAQAVFANHDVEKRIDAEIQDGDLKLKKQGGEYGESLLVNTFENDADKQNYSVGGYNIVVDSRPANTLAEVEAYCVLNDGSNTEISYQEYLALTDVTKLNFDFKLRYTGRALELTDEMVEGYRTFVNESSDENKVETERLAKELAENKITSSEYNRAIYELYFVNYYPEITAYESTSKVPLLRNYYYHQYISKGTNNYLFVFDDYMTGSFETKGGIDVSFHGFYGNMENGTVVADGVAQDVANKSVDSFIKDAFKSIGILNLYAYAVNVLSLAPFIALMLLVATLLSYSILKLRCVESITSLGATLKIVGSFMWFSSVVSAAATVIMAFFVGRNLIAVLPPVLFFATLAIRAIAFVIKEGKLYTQQLEQQEVSQTEV